MSCTINNGMITFFRQARLGSIRRVINSVSTHGTKYRKKRQGELTPIRRHPTAEHTLFSSNNNANANSNPNKNTTENPQAMVVDAVLQAKCALFGLKTAQG